MNNCCPICRSTLTRPAVLSNCLHVFDAGLRRCPLCRAPISLIFFDCVDKDKSCSVCDANDESQFSTLISTLPGGDLQQDGERIYNAMRQDVQYQSGSGMSVATGEGGACLSTRRRIYDEQLLIVDPAPFKMLRLVDKIIFRFLLLELSQEWIVREMQVIFKKVDVLMEVNKVIEILANEGLFSFTTSIELFNLFINAPTQQSLQLASNISIFNKHPCSTSLIFLREISHYFLYILRSPILSRQEFDAITRYYTLPNHYQKSQQQLQNISMNQKLNQSIKLFNYNQNIQTDNNINLTNNEQEISIKQCEFISELKRICQIKEKQNEQIQSENINKEENKENNFANQKDKTLLSESNDLIPHFSSISTLPVIISTFICPQLHQQQINSNLKHPIPRNERIKQSIPLPHISEHRKIFPLEMIGRSTSNPITLDDEEEENNTNQQQQILINDKQTSPSPSLSQTPNAFHIPQNHSTFLSQINFIHSLGSFTNTIDSLYHFPSIDIYFQQDSPDNKDINQLQSSSSILSQSNVTPSELERCRILASEVKRRRNLHKHHLQREEKKKEQDIDINREGIYESEQDEDDTRTSQQQEQIINNVNGRKRRRLSENEEENDVVFVGRMSEDAKEFPQNFNEV